MDGTENYCKPTWETNSDIQKYWTICVLQLFVNQDETSWNLKLTLIEPYPYIT